jgi:hypothetical protein
MPPDLGHRTGTDCPVTNRVGYSPGRWEKSSQEILKSHRKCYGKITHFLTFSKNQLQINILWAFHKMEYHVIRNSCQNTVTYKILVVKISSLQRKTFCKAKQSINISLFIGR